MEKIFNIPVTYSMCGIFEVKAETIEEAMRIAEEYDGSIGAIKDKEYVDGSWQLTSNEVEENKLYNK